MLNDFYIPYVSVKVSAAATSRSRSRLGCRTSRLGLGPLRLGSRLGLGLKGLVHITDSLKKLYYGRLLMLVLLACDVSDRQFLTVIIRMIRPIYLSVYAIDNN